MLKYYNNITKTLTIPCEFNEVLKDIPNDTEIIIFDEDYKYYKFSKFNQEIKENVLPDSLHNIKFGWAFNQEIKENALPKSIKNIGLYSHCNLINNLPLQLEEVCIKFNNDDTCNKEVTNLPMTLEKITIENEKYLEYITKIPFGCVILIQKIE
jgi:hypothetical protein